MNCAAPKPHNHRFDHVVHHGVEEEVMPMMVMMSLDPGPTSPTGSYASTDTECIAEAFNSQLCVMTPRMSPVGCSSESSVELQEKEMDNLVEEVYIAKQSILKEMFVQCEPKEMSLSKLPAGGAAGRLEECGRRRGEDREEERAEEVAGEESCGSQGGRHEEAAEEAVEEDHPLGEAKRENYDVVVAIDLGTTYSGYAFAYTNNTNDKQIHMMRQTEGGDRGLNNQKVPTVLLLTPEEKFHSFGFAARDAYHDLDSHEAKHWLYFDKFKMHLHNNMEVNRDSQLLAFNGQTVSALLVFSHALRYMKTQVIKELKDQGTCAANIRWVVTVPALWTQQAKQFVREAAYMADICSSQSPERLLIALEPEAASICCRNLHFNQITQNVNNRNDNGGKRKTGSYMVVDCGGGTVDITVHNVSSQTGSLRELHKATGGPCGSLGIDNEFFKLLECVFGSNLMKRFKQERPGAHNELMLGFEARKRSATTTRTTAYNIFLPFAFIDFFKRSTSQEIETAVEKYGRPDLKWSTEGILKIHPTLMYRLFQPTVDKILEHIEAVLTSRRVEDTISHLFLVGGFSESLILQHAVRDAFSHALHIIIPQAVSLSVLKGAVLYGLDPTVVTCRKVTHTYGIGVVKPFLNGIHPIEKLVIRNGQRWCVDVLERIVESGQAVTVGQIVSRKYAPASTSQTQIVLYLYATLSKVAQFITDRDVHRCGILRLELPRMDENYQAAGLKLREITVSLVFGGTEVRAYAKDSTTGHTVHTTLDFMKR